MKTIKQSENTAEKEIIELYENTQDFYSKESMSMHCGIWDKDTKNLHEANLNTNRIVADVLNIQSKDNILDAGCGVGGTTFYIAKNYGAQVTGLTLLKKQVEIANKHKKQFSLGNKVKFVQGDYTDTKFRTKSFDKILSIECVCHAVMKIDYLKEAYRVLKKGGKIAVLDAYLLRENLNEKEKKIYDKFRKGFVLDNLSTKEQFRKDMRKAGFKSVKFINLTKKVRKSTQSYYRMAGMAFPFVLILEKLGIMPPYSSGHIKSVQYTHLLVGNKLERDIATYGVFVAEK